MEEKVVSFPNAKNIWEANIFSAFSNRDDVGALHMLREFYQLYPKKNTLHLLAAFCHYHLGEEQEARQWILDMKQIQTVPSKNELYAFYMAVFDDTDFWSWYEWLFSQYQDLEMDEWLEKWLSQMISPRYELMRNVNQLQPKISPFVERFSQIFLHHDDTGMQLAWLKSEQPWEKSEYFFEACQSFFLKNSAHPFIQTMLLQQLKFEQVSYYFQIKKGKKVGDFHLEKIDFPLLSLNERKMIQEIQNYEVKNISYAQQMLRVYQQYVMYFYPFVTEYPDTFIHILMRYTNEIFGQEIHSQALTDEENQIYHELIEANQPIFSF